MLLTIMGMRVTRCGITTPGTARDTKSLFKTVREQYVEFHRLRCGGVCLGCIILTSSILHYFFTPWPNIITILIITIQHAFKYFY